MKFFEFLGKSICGIASFCKNIITISFLFVIAMVVLSVFMPTEVYNSLKFFQDFFSNVLTS